MREVGTCLNKSNNKRAHTLVNDLTLEKQARSTTILAKSRKWFTEEQEILRRWTEYCSELYNHESYGDNAVLDCISAPTPQAPKEDLKSILHEEAEIAIAALKKGTSVRVDNIPAELVQHGGVTIVDVITEICIRSEDSVADCYTS